MFFGGRENHSPTEGKHVGGERLGAREWDVNQRIPESFSERQIGECTAAVCSSIFDVTIVSQMSLPI